MVSRADVARYRDNLKEERNAVILYEQLAGVEKNPDLSTLYRKLAATERKHADVWEQRLRDAGGGGSFPRGGLANLDAGLAGSAVRGPVCSAHDRRNRAGCRHAL